MWKKNFCSLFIITFITFSILIIIILSLFEQHKKNTISNQKTIITTTTFLQDAVKHLIGDVDQNENINSKYEKIKYFSSVESLMGIGIDPHNYKTKLSDRNKIKKADLVVINGLHLESKMIETFEFLQESKKLWIVGEELKSKEKLLKKEDNSKEYDPHIWFNIDLWQEVVLNLKDKIKTIIETEDDKKKLDKNFESFQSNLTKLKQNIITEMQDLKTQLENKNSKFIVVTAHDAFSYWQQFSKENECDFQLEPIQGISTQTEASMQRIIFLAKKLADNDVKAIFTESSVPKDSLDSLKEETDKLKKIKKLKPIEIPKDVELYSDSLGTNEKIEKLNNVEYKHSTYIGTFLNNIRIIKEKLL